MPPGISRVIHPDDAGLCLVIGTLESLVLVIKSTVDDADYHATAIIGMRQTRRRASQHSPRMGDTHGAVGTQLHDLADLNIVDTLQLLYQCQVVNWNAGRDKPVKLAINPHSQCRELL